jgi:hypothetical protein
MASEIASVRGDKIYSVFIYTGICVGYIYCHYFTCIVVHVYVEEWYEERGIT